MTWAPNASLCRQWVALAPGKVAAYFAFAIALLFSPGAQAQQFDYSAVIAGQGHVNGPVNAGGIVWQCNAKYCTTRGPWPVPGVKSCNALAMIVGQLASYGHKGRMLSPGDMATCNGKQAAATQAAHTQGVPANLINPFAALLPGLAGLGANTAPGAAPGQTPATPSFSQQAAIAGTPPGPIRTPTLTVTGTGSLIPTTPTVSSFTPVTVRTSQLRVTGTTFYPITVRTRTLTVSGTGAP
ncbi:MAG TPA: hypothetical protein VHQ39_04225 [Dongiaceae bacterium]|nr:hypothetical protein [Dongiaceae bacterium]